MIYFIFRIKLKELQVLTGMSVRCKFDNASNTTLYNMCHDNITNIIEMFNKVYSNKY